MIDYNMTEQKMIEAFEKMLVPIKELYTEITTRGNQFCYPFIYTDADGDYLAYVTKLTKGFVDRVKQLDEASVQILNHAFDKLPADKKPKKSFDFMRDVDALSELVIEVLNYCYRCYPDDAFQKLKNFFEADDCYYLNMLPQLQVKQWTLYRIRKGSFDKTKDGEMFHIPFEKRHLVDSQRYSIPGYPILYLAGSFFTAWCEMDKPDLNGLNFAGFKFKNEELFVDLGYPFHSTSIWEWYSLFVMYPLLIACMVRVKNPSAPFKPEYIMPQLMTKLVREHGGRFRGIAYMSNKLPENYRLNSISSRNLAVCTNNCICIKGHDTDLASKIQMKDVHTITREELREVIKCENKFEIDFKKIEQLADSQFREIKVEMTQG